LGHAHAKELRVLPWIGESHCARSKTLRKAAKSRVKGAKRRHGMTQLEAICIILEKKLHSKHTGISIMQNTPNKVPTFFNFMKIHFLRIFFADYINSVSYLNINQ